MDKLYIVVREDLDPGLVASQAVHAGREFLKEHTAIEEAWYTSSNTLALLGVPDEAVLRGLLERVQAAGVPTTRLEEPDLGNSLTAIAIGPAGKKYVRGLRRAFRRYAEFAPAPTP